MSVTDLQKEIAITAINTMMKRSFFSICAIDKAAKILGMNVQHSPAYNALHALHCVDFADMSSNVRRAIPEMIKECFLESDVFQFPLPNTKPAVSVLGSDVIDAEAVVVEPKSGFWKRLLGN